MQKRPLPQRYDLCDPSKLQSKLCPGVRFNSPSRTQTLQRGSTGSVGKKVRCTCTLLSLRSLTSSPDCWLPVLLGSSGAPPRGGFSGPGFGSFSKSFPRTWGLDQLNATIEGPAVKKHQRRKTHRDADAYGYARVSSSVCIYIYIYIYVYFVIRGFFPK